MNSKAKGKRAELEIASIIRSYGYDAHRGQQYSGIKGDADVVGVPGLHIEVKRREALNIHEAMDQSKRDARPAEIPCVMHRKNNTEWLCTMRLDDFMTIFREYQAGLPEVWLEDDGK